MQDKLDFGEKQYDPFESIEQRRDERKLVIPQRKPKGEKRDVYQGHWVFARLKDFPQPPPRRKVVVWPPRNCPDLHWQFETLQDLKKWFDAGACSTIFRMYRCFKCGKWAAECYPPDTSGSSSGKHIRAYQWKRDRGYDTTGDAYDPNTKLYDEKELKKNL